MIIHESYVLMYSALAKVLLVIISLGYPILIFSGLEVFGLQPQTLLLAFLLFLLAQWLIGGNGFEKEIIIINALVVGSISIYNINLGLKFYPVIMSLCFLVLFVSSLFTPVSLVEKIARKADPNPSPKTILYMRKVTWVWSIFFIFNACVSTIVALWASEKTWTLYNGLIAYILIGCLFVGEWLYRVLVIKKEA